jgi:hypothetical protein
MAQPAVTPLDIVNQAIQIYGNNQSPVTGSYPNFDTSVAGVAAKNLYGPCVKTVMRQFNWDFARFTTALVLSGNTAPEPWAYEYLYPDDGIEIWQLMPDTLTDADDPAPINWTVANALVTSVPTKVIWTDEVDARVVYSNFPIPTIWDAGFREAVVRLLASEMAMATAGKTDTGQKLMESAGSFENSAETRNG